MPETKTVAPATSRQGNPLRPTPSIAHAIAANGSGHVRTNDDAAPRGWRRLRPPQIGALRRRPGHHGGRQRPRPHQRWRCPTRVASASAITAWRGAPSSTPSRRKGAATSAPTTTLALAGGIGFGQHNTASRAIAHAIAADGSGHVRTHDDAGPRGRRRLQPTQNGASRQVPTRSQWTAAATPTPMMTLALTSGVGFGQHNTSSRAITHTIAAEGTGHVCTHDDAGPRGWRRP